MPKLAPGIAFLWVSVLSFPRIFPHTAEGKPLGSKSTRVPVPDGIGCTRTGRSGGLPGNITTGDLPETSMTQAGPATNREVPRPSVISGAHAGLAATAFRDGPLGDPHFRVKTKVKTSATVPPYVKDSRA